MSDESKQFDVTETYGRYSTIEKAIEEVTLTEVAKEAKRRAELVNANNEDIIYSDVIVDDNTQELDGIVGYLRTSQVRVSGLVQFSNEGDDSPFVFAEDAQAEFQGFVISRRDSKLFYDYLFQCIVDENNVIQTLDQIQQAGLYPEKSYKKVSIQALVDQVSMSFAEMHPMRAAAILETMYPDVLEHIDSWLLMGNDVPDTERIVLSKQFDVAIPDFESQEEGILFERAINGYVKSMIDLDTQVSYVVDIDGDYLDISKLSEGAITHTKTGELLFGASHLNTFTIDYQAGNQDEHDLGKFMRFGLYGLVFSKDPLEAPRQVMLPTPIIKNIRSLRQENAT